MWKRFVQEGVIDSARINKRITESWIRCKNRYVNPYLGTGREILTGESFDSQKKKYQELLDITLPHVEKMSKFIADTGMIAILIDPEGYVLSMKGKKPILQYAGDINFVEGVRWTEDEVGTNAIGTALHAKEPILVSGTEHYSVASHKWSCSAAPIHDEEGRLVGILDISCPLEHSHPNMLAIVSSIAYTIEQEWSRRRELDELELIRCTWELAETNQPIVILNQKQQVIFANKVVRQKVLQWPSKCDYQDLLREYGYVERKRTPVYSKQHGGLLGYSAFLLEAAVNSRHAAVTLPFSLNPILFHGEAGTSISFQRVLKQIERISRSSVNVFIRGESGTGKELVARAIHENSPYKSGPFVAMNCGAIPKDLIESELFGYAEGAFTGSRRHGYKGKLEQANGGTLFLDEIGEIPHQMQVALLRVLQERKVTPIGSTSEIPVNIRVITATHRDITQLVKAGTFREDLYYRLHVFPLHVPPLRERKEDIPYLIRYYCRKNNLELPAIPHIIQQLMEYDWPGNIRELFNTLERISIIGDEEIPLLLQELFQSGSRGKAPAAVPDHLPERENGPAPPERLPVRFAKLTYREEIEKQSIIQALRKTNGSASAAAGLLGIPRSTFYRKLQKYNL
ncbi:sigma-54-dependent Fis family transcriptional regulator [Brevibacillus massiliensis]|jgi:transcriptional regulator of acetoin/glycerol metabolism|uniref:sigma-54-dependent Fis family transcriptional regulator n=1 Tax=Brevibacillus massiliensis TaxID=1118054 RepID=UPI000559684E|nr:sigma-54-dependent Fis family transcriptional regulator [Brevibacillus massiliensis]